MKNIIRNKYVMTTVLTILIYLLYLKMMSIYPFGEYSILKSDLYQQYINFFCYLKEVILHGKSVVISWNLGLANNFYTTFSYYLISPLNLLVVFFNKDNMDIFVEIITFIKILLMANFMVLFLEKSYKVKDYESALFGIIYAFSSYVICYSFHIMWLDCLYMLPIVLIFVDRYIEEKKILPLVVTLSYTILTNYYIGYMVAFFAGIYYIIKYTITREDNNFLVFIKSLSKFIFAILISFGIGMIVILPSILQLQSKMNASIELIKIDSEKIKLFINVIFNNYIYMFTQKSSFVFSSTLVTLLLPMYYLNKNISKKEKIGFSLIVLFLLLPIISPFFYKLWHGFTTPNCFNYRYSFTLIFTMILMAAREFQNIKYSDRKHFLMSFIIFFILTLIEIILMKKGYLESDGYIVNLRQIILSCIIYVIMLGLIYINSFYKNTNIINDLKKRIGYFLKSLLFTIVIIDLLIGAKSGQNNNDKYLKREIVIQYDEFMDYFTLKLEHPETQRIIFEPDRYGSNMSLKYGYSNIGFFTSARNRSTLKSMYRLGYNVQMDEQLWVTSYSGTFLNYSMAGVKYYITKDDLKDDEIYGFKFDEKYGDYNIYENKNAFNIGYYLSNNIEESYNPFKMQNEILSNLIGEDILKEEYFQNIEYSSSLDCKKLITFDKNTREYIIEYDLVAKKDCNIYLASDYDLQVYIDERSQFENYSNIWSTETGIKQIRKLKENERLKFRVVTKQNLDLLYIYVSNNEEIQKVLDNKDKNYFENIEIKNNGIIGTTNFQDNGYLVLGIAYDNCWKAYINGKETEIEAIAGSFLGIKVEKGKHEIEIKATLFPIK